MHSCPKLQPHSHTGCSVGEKYEKYGNRSTLNGSTGSQSNRILKNRVCGESSGFKLANELKIIAPRTREQLHRAKYVSAVCPMGLYKIDVYIELLIIQRLKDTEVNHLQSKNVWMQVLFWQQFPRQTSKRKFTR